MTPRINAPQILIGTDTETSGLLDDSQIVTASFVTKTANGDTIGSKSWLLKPVTAFEEEAVNTHGITEVYAEENGQEHKEGILEIVDYLHEIHNSGQYLVAYNASYDFTRFSVEAARYRQTLPAFNRVLDPMVLDREYYRFHKRKRTLGAVSEFYGCPLSPDAAHDALADSDAAVNVMFALFEHLRTADPKELKDNREWNTLKILKDLSVDLMSPEGPQIITALQKNYYERQRLSLQEWLRKKNSDDTVMLSTEWPVQTLPGLNTL